MSSFMLAIVTQFALQSQSTQIRRTRMPERAMPGSSSRWSTLVDDDQSLHQALCGLAYAAMLLPIFTLP